MRTDIELTTSFEVLPGRGRDRRQRGEAHRRRWYPRLRMVRFYLESLVEGGRQLRRIAVHPLPFRVGRLSGLSLSLASDSVSKEHAEIVMKRRRAPRPGPGQQERHLREQRARERGAAQRGRHPALRPGGVPRGAPGARRDARSWAIEPLDGLARRDEAAGAVRRGRAGAAGAARDASGDDAVPADRERCRAARSPATKRSGAGATRGCRSCRSSCSGWRPRWEPKPS